MNIYTNDTSKHKIYLAGPFFNAEQRDVADKIEQLASAAKLDFFSPRLRCCCPPDAPMIQRKISFDMNTQAIVGADLILARIDDFDAGTMWEMGYAFALKRPVYAYTTVKGRGLNLMLAQSCAGFLCGLDEVAKFLGANGLVDWKAAKSTHTGDII